MTKVLFHFVTTNGQPIPFANVEIQLTRSDFDEAISGVIMPRLIQVMTDVDGKVLQDLAPCDTRYHVTVYDTVSDVGIHHHFYVPVVEDPNTILNFQDLIVPDNTVMSSLPYDETALAVILAARLDTLAARDVALASVGSIDDSVLAAETAASIAVDAKGIVINARDQAQIYMQVAMDSSDNAEAMAGNAEASAAAALVSQNLADADAAAASTSETNAAASAASALADKNTTVAALDIAVAAKTASETARDLTIAARDIAVTNAGTSTTKAGEASQSAINAAASAATAAAAQIQSDWTQANNTLKDYIKNKPTLAAVATSGAKADVGLGNVDNTSDVNKPISTAQQAALDLKASITYVDGKVAALVASSPAALDTLSELAAALGNDANFAATTATSLGNRLRVDAAQGLTAPQKVFGKTNLDLNNVDNTSDVNKPVSTAQATAIGLKINTSAKDTSGGVPGLTLFAINMRNALNTITSFLANAATVARTWTFPDKDGTVAMTSDVLGKNKLINGDMRVDQRFVGTLATIAVNANVYTVDRWLMANTRTNGTTVTVQQDTADVPPGFGTCLKITNTTAGALAASDAVTLQQVVEGLNITDLDFGKATAKSVTMSFWAKSTVAGNYAISLRNGGVNRAYIAHYTLVANTWTYVTVTIPGETTGTWLINNAAGLSVNFDLGVGGTAASATLGSWISGANVFGSTTAVKLSATAGAIFRVTGVQLEVGSVATPFDYRNFDDEWAKCKRYFRKTFPYTMVPANTLSLTSGALFYSPYNYNGYHGARWDHGPMRAIPTVTSYSVYAGTAGGWTNPGGSYSSPSGTIAIGDASVFIAMAGGAALTPNAGDALYIHATVSSEL